MTIYLVKKEKGRVYKSVDMVRALFGVELSHDEDGAPLLEGSGKYISISDTKNHWACCVAEFPVGIDMEEKDRAVRSAVARRLHRDEQAYLSVLSEGSREWTEEFLSIWTRKEAYSKLRGKGLKLGFSRFSVLEGSGSDAEKTVSFCYKDLVFGIAGDGAADVIEASYDAPMEKTALDYAAGLLDSRAYSSASLKKKLLERGYRDDEADGAIARLKDYGYVNDESYAAELARRGAEGGKGSRRIAAELKEKGIDKGLAQAAASEYREGEYERALKAAEALAEKAGGGYGAQCDPDGRLTSEQKDELYAQRRKLAGKISRKLASLGYDAPVIYSVLEDLGL